MEKVHFIRSQESLTVLRRPHPALKVDAVLSPYAGCPFSCAYCPFGGAAKTGIKTTLPYLLEKKLRNEGRKLHVGLGLSCEPYCEAEREYNLTRNVIETLMRHSQPLQVFTKSELILRDLPLLRGYSRSGLLAVSVSLFTVDRGLAALFEPDVACPDERLDLVKELRTNEVFAGVALSPILPYLSDSREQLDELFKRVKKAGAEYVVPLVLVIENLSLWKSLQAAVARNFPNLLHRVENLYEKKRYPSLTYAMRMNDLLRSLSAKYAIPLYLPTAGSGGECAGICQELLR